jgi:hypothetical protein
MIATFGRLQCGKVLSMLRNLEKFIDKTSTHLCMITRLQYKQSKLLNYFFGKHSFLLADLLEVVRFVRKNAFLEQIIILQNGKSKSFKSKKHIDCFCYVSADWNDFCLT